MAGIKGTKTKNGFFVILAPQAKIFGIRKVKQLKKAPRKEKVSQHKTTKTTASINKVRSF